MATVQQSGRELTDQELVVARLVSMGKKDREIAAELFISVSTVRSHLRSAFAKTGSANRVQLATWLEDPAA